MAKKNLETKLRLEKATRQNRGVPVFAVVRSKRKVRNNPKRRNWRHNKMNTRNWRKRK